MLDTISDLYQYLTGITALTDRLDSYAGAPAIFDGQVPPDHNIGAMPIIVLDYPTVNQRLHTSSNINRDIETNIRVYAQVQSADGLNCLPLHSAAEAIANALITARIDVEGGVLRGANVKGPITAPTEDTTLAGRLITVRWQVEETQ